MAGQTDLSIILLRRKDLERMRELLRVFGDAFDEGEIYTAAQPDDAYLINLLDTGHFIALAAMREGAVIGGLAAYELKKFERERSELYVYDLAVAENHRRIGIATALIEQLRVIGSGRGAYVIFIQADPPVEPAVALYSKLGVRESVLHFDIAVTPQPRP